MATWEERRLGAPRRPPPGRPCNRASFVRTPAAPAPFLSTWPASSNLKPPQSEWAAIFHLVISKVAQHAALVTTHLGSVWTCDNLRELRRRSARYVVSVDSDQSISDSHPTRPFGASAFGDTVVSTRSTLNQNMDDHQVPVRPRARDRGLSLPTPNPLLLDAQEYHRPEACSKLNPHHIKTVHKE